MRPSGAAGWVGRPWRRVGPRARYPLMRVMLEPHNSRRCRPPGMGPVSARMVWVWTSRRSPAVTAGRTSMPGATRRVSRRQDPGRRPRPPSRRRAASREKTEVWAGGKLNDQVGHRTGRQGLVIVSGERDQSIAARTSSRAAASQSMRVLAGESVSFLVGRDAHCPLRLTSQAVRYRRASSSRGRCLPRFAWGTPAAKHKA